MSTQSKPEITWESDGEEVEAVLKLARTAPLSATTDERVAEQRFLAAFRTQAAEIEARRKPVRRMVWRYALAAALALAIGGGVFKLGARFHEEPLSYRVKSGEVAARFIRTNQEPVELDFSDGTVVTVDAHSGARVAETTQQGARFLLESGRMDFNVVPRQGRGNWVVEAGPFQVHVTGTIFSVEWSAVDGLLQVEVMRGHVVVEGAGQRRELGPGDSFHHREPRGSSSAESSEPIVPKQHTAEDEEIVTEPGTKPSAAAHIKDPSWGQLVASGSFDKVIDAATQRGMQACLDGCSQSDLRALADAARLGGKASLAQQALLAQRTRFVGTPDAVGAAFLLGRLAEDRGDSRATTWYNTYLREAPTGRFAGDALGRKMMLVARGDRLRALPLAREYWSKFPTGPYASHAKSLLETAGAD